MADREPDVVDASVSVISEFHSAASFVAQLRTHQAYRKLKSENGLRAKELQDSLEQGEEQVAQALAVHWREFGALFKRKDVDTRERLWKSAVSIRENIVVPLVRQTVLEGPNLDLLFLQGESLKQRTLAMKALEDLRRNTVREPPPIILNPKTSLPQSSPITHLESAGPPAVQGDVIINAPSRARGMRRFFSRQPRSLPPAAEKPSTPNYDHCTLGPSLSALSSLERQDWSSYGGPGLLEIHTLTRRSSVVRLGRQDSSCSSHTDSTRTATSGRLTVTSSVFDDAQTRSSSRTSLSSSAVLELKTPPDTAPPFNVSAPCASDQDDWPLPLRSSSRPGSPHIITFTISDDPSSEPRSLRIPRQPRSSHPHQVLSLTIPEDQELPPIDSESSHSPAKIEEDGYRAPVTHPHSLKPSVRKLDEPQRYDVPETPPARRPNRPRSSSYSSYTPSMSFPFMSYTLTVSPRAPDPFCLPIRPSSSQSDRTSDLRLPSLLSPRPQSSIILRNSRSNPYMGLCRSAWSAQESLTSGFRLVSVAEQFSPSKKVWRCRSCGFGGPAIPVKYGRGWGVDEGVLEMKVREDGAGRMSENDTASGCETAGDGKEVTVRYRWIFLAKSHAKQKHMVSAKNWEGAAFGCLFCCADAKETDTYGDVEGLLQHVVLAHGGISGFRGSSKGVNCVVGRKADGSEDWDLNIVGD